MIAADPSRTHFRLRRRSTQMLVARAQLLNDADRALIEAIYEHGFSTAEIALIRGVRARTIQRRVAAIIRHLRSSLFPSMPYLCMWR